MNVISLCSGVGGIDYAGEMVGIRTVAFCEREPFCQKVLRKHWPGVPIIDDLYEFSRQRLIQEGVIEQHGTIDLISAGYPCQPFSTAGQRKGEEDDRHLWPEVSRILSEIRPRWFVGENVAGHISLGLDAVLADLEGQDYRTQTIVLPAAAVGAPHRRDRVFVVGYSEHNGLYGSTVGRSAYKASDNEQEGTHQTGQSQGTSGRTNNGTLADAKSNTSRRLSFGTGEENTGFTCGSETLANSESGRCGETRKLRCDQSAERTAGSSQDVADTSSTGQQECHASAIADRSGYSTWCGDERRAIRAAQSYLGRSVNGIPGWLDGSGVNPLDALNELLQQHHWPAFMGQDQHPWEPPRVASGVKNRTARLKALGNAVVPWQVLPILAAIKQIDNWLGKG